MEDANGIGAVLSTQLQADATPLSCCMERVEVSPSRYGLHWRSPVGSKFGMASYRFVGIYEWIPVDMCIPYMVLYGGTIWHTMEGGIRSCEICWEEFR